MKISKNMLWSITMSVIVITVITGMLYLYPEADNETNSAVKKKSSVVKKKSSVVKKKSSVVKKKSSAEVLDEIYVKFIDVMNFLKPYTDMEITEKSLEKTINADEAQKYINAEGFEEMNAENILLQLNKAYEREYEIMSRINDIEITIPSRLPDASDWSLSVDIDELYSIEVSANIPEAEELKELRTQHVALLDEIYELETDSRKIYNENSDVKHVVYHDVLKDQVTEIKKEVEAALPPFDIPELYEMESLEDVNKIRDIIKEYINYYKQYIKFIAPLDELLYSLNYFYVETEVYAWLLETHKQPVLIDLGLALFYTPAFDNVVINHTSIDEITSIIDPLIKSFVSEPYEVFAEKVNDELLRQEKFI